MPRVGKLASFYQVVHVNTTMNAIRINVEIKIDAKACNIQEYVEIIKIVK